MRIIKQLSAIAIVVILTLSSGCASRVNRPISDENRDTELQYEGRWQVHRFKAARKQVFGSDHFNCSGKETTFTMAVRSGVLELLRFGSVHKTNVAHDGSFRLEMPTDFTYKRSQGASGNKSEITMILQGNLAGKDPTGLYTVGMASLNNQGCQARAKFSRL